MVDNKTYKNLPKAPSSGSGAGIPKKFNNLK